jgi:hypothetical protein
MNFHGIGRQVSIYKLVKEIMTFITFSGFIMQVEKTILLSLSHAI